MKLYGFVSDMVFIFHDLYFRVIKLKNLEIIPDDPAGLSKAEFVCLVE